MHNPLDVFPVDQGNEETCPDSLELSCIHPDVTELPFREPFGVVGWAAYSLCVSLLHLTSIAPLSQGTQSHNNDTAESITGARIARSGAS